MKIKKPLIAVEPSEALDFDDMLCKARRDDADIAGAIIRNLVLCQENFAHLCFHGVVFENCRFENCDFSKTVFLDVIFRGTDMSNSNFDGAYFNRCHVTACKLMGSSLLEAELKDFEAVDCQMRYVNLDGGKLCNVRFQDSDGSEGFFTACQIKNLELENCKLSGAGFFKTMLFGVDFTSCVIDGITVSKGAPELNGAIVTAAQAASLAKLMGLVIK